MGNDFRAERQLTLEKDEQLQAAKEKVKTISAKAVEAFQQTEEYNIVLFSWYYKGFELLRRYLVKHPSGVDLEKLDLEEIDQEMAIDEASQFATPADDAPVDAPLPPPIGDDAATASTYFMFNYPFFFSFFFFFSFLVIFFLGAQCVLDFLILLSERYFYFYLRTMFFCLVFMGF